MLTLYRSASGPALRGEKRNAYWNRPFDTISSSSVLRMTLLSETAPRNGRVIWVPNAGHMS